MPQPNTLTHAKVELEDDPHRAALEDNPTTQPKTGARVWIAIFSMALSFGPAVGLPFVCVASIVVQITNELGDASQLPWVVGAWSLATACSFSLGGPFSDIFGRRSIILAGQVVVLIGNIVGGTAQNTQSIIAAETLVGLGTGFVFVAYAGVPEMLPNKWRSLGLGILEGGIAIPWAVVSVLLANAMYKYATWRWLFYIAIIVQAISLVGTALFYWPTSHPQGDFDKSRWTQFREIDWIGLGLFTAGLAVFLIGLTWGGSASHPWKSASTIVPIVLGLFTIVAAFIYDFFIAKAPMFPLSLFSTIRGFLLVIVVLFISGMNYNSLSALLPQGSLYMFTTDGIEIGVLALPNTLMQGVCGFLVPLFSHKIGHIKWQFVAGTAFQAIFIGASAATVNPNHKLAWAFVPAFGVPMFVLCTILGYSIASLHVPHSHLGLAMGLLGTFRSAGGAVGNAIFNTIFQDKFKTYSGEEIARAALQSGLNATDLGLIIPGTIQHNLGVPGALDAVPGMTPEIQEVLRHAVRLAYGRAFQFVFYITIAFSTVAVICALFVEDPTAFMTNHVQSAMVGRGHTGVVDGAAPVSSTDDKPTESHDEKSDGNTAGGVIVSLLLMVSLYHLAAEASQKDLRHTVVPVGSFVATALLCPLLYLERLRSIRPADLVVVFLIISSGCDMALAIQEGFKGWMIPTTRIALKILLIATESRNKQRILKPLYSSQSPEELAGILSRTFFWWIIPILALGNQIILSVDDLPPIDQLLTSEKLRRDGLKAEEYATSVHGTSHPSIMSDILSLRAAGSYQLCGSYTKQPLRWRQTEALLQKLRAQELEMAKKVRWMMVAYNASANALGIFSPILTFVIFVLYANLRGSTLDAETAFTTTALLGLVTHPANMIMTIVPRAIGSLAAFGRIQDYLVRPGRADERLLLRRKDDDALSAICFEAITVQSHSSSRPILENINFTVNQGSVFICAGAVGSGKTVLAQCILGEIPLSSGTISVSTKRIAYCEQSPWLPSGTLKEAVCGFEKFEAGWYKQVVKLCCLDEDISAFPLGGDTLIGSRGLKLSGGQRQRLALARAVYARCEIVLLDDSFSALDHNTEGKVVSNLLGTHGHFRKTGTTVILIANSTKHFSLADSLIILENGRVTYQGSPNAINEEAAHLHHTPVSAVGSEDKTDLIESNETIQSQALKVNEAMADLGRSAGDFSLYASYSFFVTFPQYWLQKWTESPGSQTKFYIGGYLILSLLAWTATNGSMWSTHMLIAPTSGAELHRRLLSTVFGAPLLFFSMTETGSILNRFSEDMQLVDKSLPPAILSLSNQVFKLLVQATLLFSAQKLLAATLPICILVVYVVQRVYLRISRQLRLLQLESQSAVYSSFLESVEGVVSIRCFGWVKQAETTNMGCLDKSQQPAYILLCLQLWLNIVLDLVIAAMAVILITLAVFLEGSTTAGQIGMSLNIVLVANSTLLALVTSWTNLEISLGAISRLKTLEANTPAEEQPTSGATIPDSWPLRGAVEVRDLTVSYEETNVPALKNINLSIDAGQHLVICGRTGSGKSTLLLALLRLLNAQSGAIEVDGIDLNLVPLSFIRERCFITVTQDPFLLAQASLRFNLDPSETLSDSAIMKALERTGLCEHFDSNPEAKLVDILDDPLNSLPHMSTGQTQLFALTRAILRAEHSSVTGAKPILLLDEATSSVDGLTESTMRRIVKDIFTDNGHTVIEITHRLSGFEGIARTGGQSQQVKVILLSQGEIQSQRGIEDVLDFGKAP
ncbi:drug facilitator PEP5 [Fusarium tjaetaba]|uniref:Drug facilitator PEP5 n=1 Tax=Fusarium tjaetaba TaxID=1567544 RepID=A0A8H5R5Q4_9HYPO|nr:drug facilitator PEP5 [Fusarium tjaetaba]KAF5626828.1 drug facilitator PEP5 [Fusarium tjaetaba]